MNYFVISGRLTHDPKKMSDKVVRYSMAVDNPFGKESKVDYLDVVAFGEQADFAMKYLHKGMKMLVNGRIKKSSYKDKNDKTVYTQDLVIDHQEFCEKKEKDSDK